MNALVVLLLLLLSSFQAEISASHASVNRYIASEIKKYDVPGVAVAFVIDGQAFTFSKPWVYKSTDPVDGEV